MSFFPSCNIFFPFVLPYQYNIVFKIYNLYPLRKDPSPCKFNFKLRQVKSFNKFGGDDLPNDQRILGGYRKIKSGETSCLLLRQKIPLAGFFFLRLHKSVSEPDSIVNFLDERTSVNLLFIHVFHSNHPSHFRILPFFIHDLPLFCSIWPTQFPVNLMQCSRTISDILLPDP